MMLIASLPGQKFLLTFLSLAQYNINYLIINYPIINYPLSIIPLSIIHYPIINFQFSHLYVLPYFCQNYLNNGNHKKIYRIILDTFFRIISCFCYCLQSWRWLFFHGIAIQYYFFCQGFGFDVIHFYTCILLLETINDS